MRIFLFVLISVSLFNCQPTKSDLAPSDPANKLDIMATYILMRHAEKADDGTRNPDLNEEGKQRAQNLVDQLKDKNIKYIYSSDYKRTRQTVAPLAEALGIEVIIYDPGKLEEFKDELLLKHQSRERVLIVGHSNTTPTLANLIIAADENPYVGLDEKDYGDFFLIAYIKGGFKVSEKTKEVKNHDIFKL